MAEFELSDDTHNKLNEVVSKSENLSKFSSPDNVISFLSNYYLIREGHFDGSDKLAKKKEEVEAKQDALKEWMDT